MAGKSTYLRQVALLALMAQMGSYVPAEESGLLGVMPGMIGCYQASEAIKILAGFGDSLSGKLLIINIKNNSFSTFEIPNNPDNKNIKNLRDDYTS